MLIHMLEEGMQVDEVYYAETGFEFPEHYEYMKVLDKYLLDNYGITVKTVTSTTTFEHWFYGAVTRGKRKGQQRGMPLSLFPCYWSREAKYKPLDKVCKGNIRYIGIAVDEPKRLHPEKYDEGYRYPLADWGWTEQYCREFLEQRGLLNPLYQFFNRLGCWFCPKQSRKALLQIREHWPGIWQDLLAMEVDSPNGFSHNLSPLMIEIELSKGTTSVTDQAV